MADLRDYFEREAGEYVGRLRELVEHPTPDPGELLAAARALRGSAQMAREGRVQEVAGALETAAVGLVAGDIAWGAGLATAAAAAIDDVHALLRADEAPDALEERVATAVGRLVALGVPAGGATTSGLPGSPPWGDAELFRFAAHELGGARAALEAAWAGLEREPRGRGRLLPLADRLRALLGAAHLDRLGPVAPVLRALDDVARSASRAVPEDEPRLAQLLRAARDALQDAEERLAEGRATVEHPAFRRVLELHASLGLADAAPEDAAPEDAAPEDAAPEDAARAEAEAAGADGPGADAGPETAAAMDREQGPPVPIDRLLYRGDAALERATELREGLLRRAGADGELRAALDELFDLIELART